MKNPKNLELVAHGTPVLITRDAWHGDVPVANPENHGVATAAAYLDHWVQTLGQNLDSLSGMRLGSYYLLFKDPQMHTPQGALMPTLVRRWANR